MRATTRWILGLGLGLQLAAAAPALGSTLEGSVVHEGSEKALDGLAVHLVQPTPEGGRKSAETQTANGGRFRFDDLSGKGPFGVYVEYEDVAYPLEIVTLPGDAADEKAEVTLEIYDRSFETGGIQVFDLRTILDRGEAGTYRVQHNVLLANPEKSVVFAQEGEEPLVQIGLLPRHESLTAGLSMRLDEAPVEIDGDRLAYRGPVFPGFQALEIVYQVDAGGSESLESELWFPTATSSFRLMVPDQRQAVYATGLYPSRRNEDPRANEPPGFQYFRGFEIPAGKRLPIRIEPIPAREGSGAAAAIGVGLLLFGLCMFVGMPVVGAQRQTLEVQEGSPEQVARAALEAALAELEHDFEVGKITAEDRDRLRDEVRREAALELALARRSAHAGPAAPGSAPSSEAAASPAFCSQCGKSVRGDDRFCSACGNRL